MMQNNVDYYINLFNDVCIDGGVIYLSNSRDYIYQREFTYPPNWKRILIADTPRSWSPHYPVEIFEQRHGGDFSAENAIKEATYLNIACARYRQEISQLQDRLEKVRTYNENLRKRIEALSAGVKRRGPAEWIARARAIGLTAITRRTRRGS